MVDLSQFDLKDTFCIVNVEVAKNCSGDLHEYKEW